MGLHDVITDWMAENGWQGNLDGLHVSGPDLREGGRLEDVHPSMLIINQLGWERMLNRADEPGSLTLAVRLEIEAAGRTPHRDPHKMTRQVLDLFYAERRGSKVAAGAR